MESPAEMPSPATVARSWSMGLRHAPPWLPGAIVPAGVLAWAAVNLPGHLSYDSVVQLAQGRAGIYNLWHPPVMAWLLGIADALAPGPALFVAFDASLIAAAFAAFALLARRFSWTAALVAAALIATPQLAIYPAI